MFSNIRPGSARPRRRLHAGVVLSTTCLLLWGCADGDASSDEEFRDPGVVPDTEVVEGDIRASPATSVEALALEPVDVPTTALLIGIGPVSGQVTWMAGTGGQWLRTTDGGASWDGGVVPGAGDLQFRDVHGFHADTAVLLAAGEGSDSRIFRSEDGGATWTQTFVMDHPDGFLDCMDFWTDGSGLVYGDAVEGSLYLLRTGDGGRSWQRVDPAELPEALEGEGGFAASGTCLRTGPEGQAWVATGNGTGPRLLMTEDRGATWTVTELPLVAGVGNGATSVGFSDTGLGYVAGGSLGGEGGLRVALSADGGLSWSPGGEPPMTSAVYGGAWVPESYALVAAGPGGLDWSGDGGMSWTSLSTLDHWSVAFADGDTGWAAGPDGRVTRIRVER